MHYSVGEVARETGVTVRALHHYDEINLLTPRDRTAAGYRRYTEDDLERLRHILTYRELGFSLEQIATMLNDPSTDMDRHLRRQRGMLTRRLEHTQRMIAALDKVREAQHMGYTLTAEERRDVWGSFNPEAYDDEAEARWGASETYQQSRERTRSYTRDDWQQMSAESVELTRGLAAAMTAGTPASDPAVMDLAEAHRQHIARWFYDCTHEMHRGLGQMYVDDPRFTSTVEGDTPGLAPYVRDAIAANAARHGA